MVYAIIGLGIAGLTAAKVIRELDPKGEIHIFSEEPTLYYPRPKLFEVIREEIPARDIYFYDSMWYEERNINLHLGTSIRKIDSKSIYYFWISVVPLLTINFSYQMVHRLLFRRFRMLILKEFFL